MAPQKTLTNMAPSCGDWPELHESFTIPKEHLDVALDLRLDLHAGLGFHAARAIRAWLAPRWGRPPSAPPPQTDLRRPD